MFGASVTAALSAGVGQELLPTRNEFQGAPISRLRSSETYGINLMIVRRGGTGSTSV